MFAYGMLIEVPGPLFSSAFNALLKVFTESVFSLLNSEDKPSRFKNTSLLTKP
jgi:hypothetical protein